VRIPVDKIVVNKEVIVRSEVDPQFVEELANSMRVIGQINPILVRATPDGMYEIIDGLHRYVAARKLGWSDIEANVVSLSDVDALIHSLSLNIQRLELQPMQIAEALHKLAVDYGLSETEIARRVGRSTAWVSQHLMLKLKLSPKVKNLLSEGKLTFSHGLVLAKIPDEDRQEEFAELILKNKWSVEKALEELPIFLNDTIFTIGYEGKGLEDFINVLKKNEIQVVIDVREQAEFVNPTFSEELLKRILPQHGIMYIHMPELGVPKVLREPYVEGRVSHECFKAYYTYYLDQRIESLLKIIDKYRKIGRMALMCFERFPKPHGIQKHYCHRNFIAEKLVELKVFKKREDL